MKIYRDFILALISQIFNYIIPFLVIIYLSHIYSKKDIVLLFFTQSLIQSFVALTDYGYAIRGSRLFANKQSRKTLAIIANNIYSTKFILFSFSVFILILLTFLSEYIRNNIFFILLYIGVLIANILFPGWAFIGKKEFKFIYLNNIITYTLLLICIFLFIRNDSPFHIVAFIYSFSFLLPAFLGFLKLKKDLNLHFSFQIREVIRELKEGFNMFLSTSIKSFYLNFPIILLGSISNPYILYNFSYPDKIVKLAISFYNYVMRLSLPFFLEEKTLKLKNFLSLLLISVFGLCIILNYFKSTITQILFNVNNLDITYNLLIISICIKLIYIYLIYVYYYTNKKESIVWKIYLIGLVILTLFIFIAIKIGISVGFSIILTDLLILFLFKKYKSSS